jgi:hypothetical protein
VSTKSALHTTAFVHFATSMYRITTVHTFHVRTAIGAVI